MKFSYTYVHISIFNSKCATYRIHRKMFRMYIERWWWWWPNRDKFVVVYEHFEHYIPYSQNIWNGIKIYIFSIFNSIKIEMWNSNKKNIENKIEKPTSLAQAHPKTRTICTKLKPPWSYHTHIHYIHTNLSKNIMTLARFFIIIVVVVHFNDKVFGCVCVCLCEYVESRNLKDLEEKSIFESPTYVYHTNTTYTHFVESVRE